MTVEGAAADAKAVGDRLTAVQDALGEATGCEPINFSDPNDHYYIVTGDVGTVLTLQVKTQSRLSKYAIVDCVEGDVFMVSGSGGDSSDRLWAFIDNMNTVLSCSDIAAYAPELIKLVAPAGSAKLLINTRESLENAKSYKGVPVPEQLFAYDNRIETVETIVDDTSEVDYHGNLYHGDGTITFVTSLQYLFEQPLPAGTYTLSALVTTDDTDADNNRFLVIGNSYSGTITRNSRASTTFTVNSPIKGIKFMAATTTAVSTGKTATWADIVLKEGSSGGDYKEPQLTAIDYVARDNIRIGTAYVSVNGNDESGTGTSDSPFATVNHALEEGASTILVKAGAYKQTINIGLAKSDKIWIYKETTNGIVTFMPPNAVLAETEEPVAGYTKVYKAPFTGTFSESNIWLFQDSVPDSNTLISDDERHPLQRGYVHRCHDTKITRTSATDLSDALQAIETYDGYLWFYDSTNSELYFSRPMAVSETNPICGSFNDALFTGNNRSKSIDLLGINVKYMRVNFDSLAYGHAKNCKVSNVFGAGCFTYNYCEDAVFDCCEAERAFNGTNGDGFNGHGVNTGEPQAKITHGTLISCWSHDNRDDGFSDHERCESLIIGGLYEYNHLGGGIAPSTGSHTECHNAYARKNGEAGFVYMNDTPSAEGGVGGQLICYDCVAENNTIWTGHTQAGFKITSNNNIGIFVNCKSIGQDNAYCVNNAASKAVLIDCGSRDCATLMGGSGVFTIKNTTLVT